MEQENGSVVGLKSEPGTNAKTKALLEFLVWDIAREVGKERLCGVLGRNCELCKTEVIHILL